MSSHCVHLFLVGGVHEDQILFVTLWRLVQINCKLQILYDMVT